VGEHEQPAKSSDVVPSPEAAAAGGGTGKHEQPAESDDGMATPEVAAAAGGTRPEAEQPEASDDQSMLPPVPSLSPASAPDAPLKQRPVASIPDETKPSGSQQPPAWTRGDSDGDSSDTEGRPDEQDDNDDEEEKEEVMYMYLDGSIGPAVVPKPTHFPLWQHPALEPSEPSEHGPAVVPEPTHSLVRGPLRQLMLELLPSRRTQLQKWR